MRIHSENTHHYIQILAASASRDPLSLSDWHCVHVSHATGVPMAWYHETLKRIKEAHPDADCDVVHCPDNDTLFISRTWKSAEIYELASELADATQADFGTQGEIQSYSLMHDCRRISDLLLNKAPEAPRLTVEVPTTYYNFGEVASFKEVFEEARLKRRARAPLHVMIVDDDPLTRRLVANTLKEDHALISAANAQEAVSNYLLHAPDIVFLDIGLPDTSGFDVLHQIMASDPEAYVVMFSGNSYLENVLGALSAGASGFLAKPFKKEVMKHYIFSSAMHHAKQVC